MAPFDSVTGLAKRRREERRAVDEAGGGESEGFELSEAALIANASHEDQHTTSLIMRDAAGCGDTDTSGAVYGEADAESLTD